MTERTGRQEDNKKIIDFNMRRIYKFLKENVIINNEQPKTFIEKTQIFSIPIFYQMLFLFTLIKTFLSGIYFVITQNIYLNFNTSLIFVQLIVSFLLSGQQHGKIKNLFSKGTFLEGMLKYIYIITFCLEENMTSYYYDHFIFNLNPGFIFFILLLIVFYDLKTTKKFHEFMFYLYILNLVLLITFLSIKNIMHFFVPFNLVLSMFILLNVISQNFHKKMVKMKVYHHFFENLVSSIFKINKDQLYILYDKKVIYRGQDDEQTQNTQNTQNAQDSQDDPSEKEILLNSRDLRESTEMSELYSEYSVMDTKCNNEMEIVPIENFKGFELTYRNSNFNTEFLYFNKNQIVSFINLLFFLKNTQNSKEGVNSKCDKNYMYELENIYNNSKRILKNKKLINLITKGVEDYSFPIRDKIITLIISFVFEASKASSDLLSDDFLQNISLTRGKLHFLFNKQLFENDFYRKHLKSLLNFIDELSKCLNFFLEIKESKATISIKFDAFSLGLGESYFSNGGSVGVSHINKKEPSMKIFNLNTEEEIDLEDLKVMTPRSFGKKRISFYDSKAES